MLKEFAKVVNWDSIPEKETSIKPDAKLNFAVLGKGLGTCADCTNLNTCDTIQGWYAKNGYKYKKYKEAVEFIRKEGYPRFITLADTWKNAYGKIK